MDIPVVVHLHMMIQIWLLDFLRDLCRLEMVHNRGTYRVPWTITKTFLQVWSLPDGSLIHYLKPFNIAIKCIAFSPKSSQSILVANNDLKIKVRPKEINTAQFSICLLLCVDQIAEIAELKRTSMSSSVKYSTKFSTFFSGENSEPIIFCHDESEDKFCVCYKLKKLGQRLFLSSLHTCIVMTS